LDTRINIKEGQLSTTLYCKPTDNLMMLHLSSFTAKHIKKPPLMDKPSVYTESVRMRKNATNTYGH